MTSRAHELFQHIVQAASPVDALHQMVRDKRPETEFLDFKGGGQGKISDKDVKAHWSIALSGFGNTEGGVLVWGIRAARVPIADDPGRRIDAASELDLIHRPQAFAQLLKDVLLEACVDPIQGIAIETFGAEESKEPGFVVCLIPQGDHKPYRAALEPAQQYYQRIGDNFVKIPHSLLRSLFYPRVAPNLVITLVPKPHHPIDNSQDPDKRRATFPFVAQISNIGTASASDVFVSVRTNVVQSRFAASPPWFQMVAELQSPCQNALTAVRSIHPGQEAIGCFTCWLDTPAYWNLANPRLDRIEFDVRIFANHAGPAGGGVTFTLADIQQGDAKVTAPVNE